MKGTREIYHLKGFTLVEMLIVILLTSIIVSLTFLYFNTIQKYIITQSNVDDYELEIMRFESFLRYDINRSSGLTIIDDELIMSDLNVTYFFSDELIIRDQYEQHDTLKVSDALLTPVYDEKLSDLLVQFKLSFYDADYRLREYVYLVPQDIETKYKSFLNSN